MYYSSNNFSTTIILSSSDVTPAPEKNINLIQIWNATSYNGTFGKIAIDKYGNIYAAGGAYLDRSNTMGILAKFDSTGHSLWNRTFITSSNISTILKVIVDNKDAIYVSLISYNFSNIIHWKIDIMKYDLYGNLLWRTNINDNESISTIGGSFCLDPNNNNIYIVTILGLKRVKSNGVLRLTKMDSNGNILWKKNFTVGNISPESAPFIITGNNGDIFVAHNYMFGENSSIILKKFDDDGNPMWELTWGGSKNDFVRDLAVDSEGNIYIAGETESFSQDGSSDALLLKYTPSQELVWNVTFGTKSHKDFNYAYGMGLDPDDNAYIVGHLAQEQNYKVLLAEYNSDGVLEGIFAWNLLDIVFFDLLVPTYGQLYVVGVYLGKCIIIKFELDSDNDGITDVNEISSGTDPYSADTDGDGWDDKSDFLPTLNNWYILGSVILIALLIGGFIIKKKIK
ncbi:MAG: SBBP repeat-containing protein [Candidatus Asgardarchaeia archaeon]